MINVIMLDERKIHQVGFIPAWLNKDDPRPAKEQLHEHYGHGGGWHTFEGFTLVDGYKLKYPGDPAYEPFAAMKLRKETILMYDHGWVAIFQPDNSFEVSRLD